jgi:molecular chaperone GrpE
VKAEEPVPVPEEQPDAPPDADEAVGARADDAAGEHEPAADRCARCAGYLDSLTRLKAEFANYRRRAAEQQSQAAERGAADLVTRLLAVLDASEAGAAHHGEVVGPLHQALVEALAAEGLEIISPAGEPFDPNYHEAVMHESAETPGVEQVVTDVLRTGYAWGGRVLRPAVVGVRG